MGHCLNAASPVLIMTCAFRTPSTGGSCCTLRPFFLLHPRFSLTTQPQPRILPRQRLHSSFFIPPPSSFILNFPSFQTPPFYHNRPGFGRRSRHPARFSMPRKRRHNVGAALEPRISVDARNRKAPAGRHGKPAPAGQGKRRHPGTARMPILSLPRNTDDFANKAKPPRNLPAQNRRRHPSQVPTATAGSASVRSSPALSETSHFDVFRTFVFA